MPSKRNGSLRTLSCLSSHAETLGVVSSHRPGIPPLRGKLRRWRNHEVGGISGRGSVAVYVTRFCFARRVAWRWFPLSRRTGSRFLPLRSNPSQSIGSPPCRPAYPGTTPAGRPAGIEAARDHDRMQDGRSGGRARWRAGRTANQASEKRNSAKEAEGKEKQVGYLLGKQRIVRNSCSLSPRGSPNVPLSTFSSSLLLM